MEDRWMDEHLIVEGGRVITFDGGFSDHNLNDLSYFTEKHNNYATREAIDVLNKKYHLFDMKGNLPATGTSAQAAIKRIIKENIYNNIPLWLGPCGYFLYRYFIQLGVLDGIEGFIYHFLQGFWYRVLVGAKVVEFDRVIAPLPEKQDRLAALSRLTGYEFG
jgi:hypothetical protein